MKDLFLGKHEIGMKLLAADIEYRHIPESDREKIIDMAWAVGKEAAQRIKEKFPYQAPSEIARILDVKVLDSDIQHCCYYSEYDPAKKEIVLYFKNIMSESLGGDYMRYNEYQVRREAFIAHELFHHLEYTDSNIQPLQKRYRVVLFDLKWFRLTHGLRSMSEIGAYSFTKTLLNIL